MPFVTYHAPAGDSKVVEYFGVEFYSGQPVELDAKQHARLIAKASRNPHFAVSEEAGVDDYREAPAPAPRRGRRPKSEEAGGDD